MRAESTRQQVPDKGWGRELARGLTAWRVAGAVTPATGEETSSTASPTTNTMFSYLSNSPVSSKEVLTAQLKVSGHTDKGSTENDSAKITNEGLWFCNCYA